MSSGCALASEEYRSVFIDDAWRLKIFLPPAPATGTSLLRLRATGGGPRRSRGGGCE